MAADPRYDVVLADPVSGESVGLILDEPLQWQSTQPMAARITEAKDWRSFDEWSVIEQSSWHHGRGLEIWDSTDPERFYDSQGVETRIRDQLTLAPGVTITSTGDDFPYRPADSGMWEEGPLRSGGTGNVTKLAQSFSLSSERICKGVCLPLKCNAVPSSGTVTLRLETDSAGSPSGTLVNSNAFATINASTLESDGFAHMEFALAGNVSLSASTTYWLVLSHSAANTDVYWRANTQNLYGGGSFKYYDGAWQALSTHDCFFVFRYNLVGEVRCFGEYNGKWYCGTWKDPGGNVYEWDNTNKKWVAKKTDFASSLTSMVSFAGKLWCAQSSTGTKAWTYNGSTWTEQAFGATWFLVWKGYLYRAAVTGQVYYTSDGSTWSPYPWQVGNTARNEYVSGLAGHGYDVLVGTSHGVYLLGPESMQGDLVDQLIDLSSQTNFYNANLLTWARDGKAYIPVLGSLLSYQDGLLESVGPDRDAGLPAQRQGRVTALLSLANWLIAAISSNEADSIGSVLVYNGIGWHELARSWRPGAAMRALGYDTTTTPHRLWFGVEDDPCYIELPDTTDNPYTYPASHYTEFGRLQTPKITLDLRSVDKDFQEFGIQGEIPGSTQVDVYYRVDNYSNWTFLGGVYGLSTETLTSYSFTFPFEQPFAQPTSVVQSWTRSSIEVDEPVAKGTWIRINDEVRQVQFTQNNGFYLYLSRPFRTAPSPGDRVYPARPCGQQIEFLLVLKPPNSLLESPKLQAWWLKCMPMISDKLGAALVSTIYDGQKDHAGATLESASTRAALLHSFAKRPTPIDLTDKAGTTRRVKVTSISEVQRDWQEGAMGHARGPRRTFSLSVVEI